MTATVNGREYSRASLAEIYWSFGEMISYASRGTRVRDRRRHRLGDVRHRLHPRARAGARRRRVPVAAAGDEVVLSVDRLGSLRNRVVAGAPLRPLR